MGGVHATQPSSTSMQGILNLAVHTLHHAIGLGVESRCQNVLHAQLAAECSPCGGGELRAAVCCHCSWHAKTRDPARYKMFGTGCGLHVFEENGLNPPRRPINNSEKIRVAILRSRKRTHKVHMDVGESLAGHRELLQGCCRLLCYLATLARLTVTSHGTKH
jgi:hypothetical protein